MKKHLNTINFLLLLLIIGYLTINHFKITNKTQTNFEEINVERINVIEKDGTPKMIITNKERQPTEIKIDGKPHDYGRGKSGGILMYNDLGEENGGFLFGGDEKEHGSILTFDQYKQDQVLVLKNSERRSNGKVYKLYGLGLFERSDSITTKDIIEKGIEIEKIQDENKRDSIYKKLNADGFYGANTFFAGRMWDGSTGLFVRDKKGNTKIQIYVNSEGEPVIQYIDSLGNKKNLIK